MSVAFAMALELFTSVVVQILLQATATVTETSSTPLATVAVIAQPMPTAMASAMT
jgi:hypothetical protein